MKKLFPILTMALVIFAGSLSFDTQAAETNAPAAMYAGVEDGGKVLAKGTADSGATAWMIVATALVLFMTIPGLSLFYGGLARRNNVLSILVQCFAITALMSLLWTIYGYSMATTGSSNYLGGFDKLLMNGVGTNTLANSGHVIPESVYFTFQMTFAIITPALIVGAFAERMKFSAVMVFVTIWFTFSYLPVWHMAWAPFLDAGGLFVGGDSGNWMMGKGEEAVDFAGGTVVHINAGIAGLVACIMLGRRKGFPDTAMAPHNVPLVVIGASMLWVGWFGFNAGSTLAADGTAGMALLVTQVATAAAAFTWMMVEWCAKGKPTAVGIATGAVAGLVAITPASGSVGPLGAIVIGIAAGLACYWAATSLKKKLGYDDSFDVFGVHGIGGIVGALLAGCLAIAAVGAPDPETGANLGGVGESFSLDGLWTQAKAVLFTIFWSGVVAFIAIKIAGALCGGIRVDEETELEGLDVKDHGEDGYSL
jgi:Amt family ammonium transporter